MTNPAPQAVYQTSRTGTFTYTLVGLIPGAAYTLRLDFADPTSTAAGQRQFNVSINGTPVLTNFDVFAAAGARNKAVAQAFAATANAQGQVTVSLAKGAVGVPLLNGIEVISGGTTVQAINCGLLAGSTLTINPTSFMNLGILQAANGETLAVGGLIGNLNAATMSGASNLGLTGTNYVINQGLIVGAGQTLTLGGTWSNAVASTIAASGGTLNLGDASNAWSNTGTITVSGATANLGGSFTLPALGLLERSGGTINLVGTLDDTGTGLNLDAATGSWNLAGGTLKNGTYSASGGAELTFLGSNSSTLDGVTANSDLDFASNGAYVTVTNGLTLAGGVTLQMGNAAGSTASVLTFNGTQTLGGSGTVLFGSSPTNRFSLVGTGTLTLGRGITIRGTSGGIGGNAIVNQATIAADGSGGVSSFAYDTGFSGGVTTGTADAIDTSSRDQPGASRSSTRRIASAPSLTR